jgi:hypothetical protein
MTSNLSTMDTFDILLYVTNHIKYKTQDEGCQECGAVYGD